EEPSGLLRCAEAHDRLDAGPVVPTSIEDHHLASRREVLYVALDVHLGLLAIGWGGQCHDPEDTWADPFGDPLDRATLPGSVAALEDDADLGSRCLNPFLERNQLAVQESHLGLVLLALHLG